MTTTIEILKAARDLIAKPENWAQGEYATDRNGGFVMTSDPEAYCFCSIGAVARASGCLADEAEVSDAVKALATAAGYHHSSDVISFNDNHLHSEVLDLFSKAISSAEEKAQ